MRNCGLLNLNSNNLITMQDSVGSRAIKVTPEELTFDQLVPNIEKVQDITFKNNLSAPVDITLKTSNFERLQIEPKSKRLAPFESFTAQVTARIAKTSTSGPKAPRFKELVKIQSDFFDQKVNVTLIPSPLPYVQIHQQSHSSEQSSSRNRASSVGESSQLQSSSIRQQNKVQKKQMDDKSPIRIEERNSSKSPLRNEEGASSLLIEELTHQVKLTDDKLKTALTQLEEAEFKIQELESTNRALLEDSNETYLEEVRLLLSEREPKLETLVDISLKKERNAQQAKDAKVLGLLQSKDARIEELEQRTVQQEADYGKLAQAFQDQKRLLRALEEQEANSNEVISDLEEQLNNARSKLTSFEGGKEYRKLIDTEDRLKQAQAYIEQLELTVNQAQEQALQKDNVVSYLQEAIQRLKDQASQHDQAFADLSKKFESEKEKRIREEESHRHNLEQLKSSGSISGEPSDLLRRIEALQSDKLHQENNIRDMIDKINNIRPLAALPPNKKSVMEVLEAKIKDLSEFASEIYDENLTLVEAVKEMKSVLSAKDQDIQVLTTDNKQLSLQIHEMVSKKTFNRSQQTDIDGEEMDTFEELKDKCTQLEDENDSIAKNLREKDRLNSKIQGELDSKTQEVNILIKQQAQSLTSSQVIFDQRSSLQSNEDLVSKLNARISQLKQNEEILLQELGKLRQTSQQSMDTKHKSSNSNQTNFEAKLIEYEAVVFEQSERVIKLEEENAFLKRQIKDLSIQNAQQLEQASLRIKNLQDINSKQESLALERDTFSEQTLTNIKPGDIERLRQTIHQSQIQNINLKHQVEELRVELMQKHSEGQRLREELNTAESILVRLKQDARLSDSGFRDPLNRDPNLQQKVIEQKNQIKQLQGLLIRAKQDFDKLAKTQNQDPHQVLQTSGDKTNERLRKEHHQALMSVIDLKEEYSSKLLILSEKHDSLRSKLQKENSKLLSKLDSLTVQLSHMETKELRLYGQLEEAKQLQQSESKEHEARTKDLEELIFKKEGSIADLEREIRTKDKTLMERQEQISVLIATLEGESTKDELRQKLLNMSAELCSVRAIESQQIRKMNEMNLNLKKSELAANKYQKALEQAKVQHKETNQYLMRVEEEKSVLERRVQELSMQIDEKSREVIDLKYRVEKEEFQMKLKEENVMQARDQIKRAEQIFKEEVERLRNEFFDQVTKDYSLQTQNSSEGSKNTIQFQTILKQIHVTLCDLVSETKEGDDKALLKDFEKAIQVASQTIEKLNIELDKSNFQTMRFKQNLKALALNKIVISRQESLQIKLQKFQQSLVQREEERSSLNKAQEVSIMKIMREQELKLAHLTQELKSVEEENYQLRDDLRLIRDQKDEIEQSLVLFEQEIESKKQAMEKNAELTVDDRFKAKHEAIKCYFDSQLTKILIGQNQISGNERVLDMGREILALKLLVQKLESQIVYEQSESQSLELNLAHYKEQMSVNEQRIRELQAKNNQLSLKLRQNNVSQRMELQKSKQQAVSLEKELIKVRESLETKSREFINLIEAGGSPVQVEKKEENRDMQIAEKDHIIKNQQATIEELQEKLLDVRSTHIQEIEYLRVQYDSQLAEGKLQLTKDREQLEKRYLPGHAPGDVQQENQELLKRVQELRASLDQFIHENVILKKKYENENLLNDTLKREVESYKQAIVDLEATMVEMGRISHQQYQSNHVPGGVERSGSRGRQMETDKKPSKKSMSKNGKKLTRDHTAQSLGQPIEDTTSLMTSNITSIPENNQQTIKVNQTKGFNINPPALVKALVQSKLNELQALKKYDDLLQIEISLRHELKEMKLRELHSGLSNQQYDNENEQLSRKVIELQVEVEDLRIQRAHEQVDQIQLKASQYHQGSSERGEIHIADYNTLIDAVMGLSIQLAIAQSQFNKKIDEGFGTQGNPQAIEEAQRLVIRDLQTKINGLGNFFDGQNQHYEPPTEEQDRKLWYLELLESQVIASENVMTGLQSFIKKLQIDVQGSLQSAASIKSASMDLANNLKRTSEEIKQLKHVASLAKHDLAKSTFNNQKTINPFAQQDPLHQSIKGNSMNSQSIYNQLMQQQDHIQNQLFITEKVKKSLEDELVSLKVAHQQELNQLNQRLTQAMDQRNSMLQNNEDLHERVNSLQLKLDELKAESAKHSQDYQSTQALLLEKERDKQLLAQTKTVTSKHLAKLQSDMQDWRRQTDENMRIKEKQVEELQASNTALQKERDRLKSENGMLRRVDRDRRGGESEEMKKVVEENAELGARLQEMMEERRKEVEYWVSERATMREMIEQLENDKVGQNEGATVLPEGGGNNEQDGVKQIKKKYSKKIKEKELEIKTLHGKLESLKDEAHRARQLETQLDQKLREQQITLQETEEHLKYLSQRLKEVELERDLILAEKNNAISSNDLTAQHIQDELNSLRECFAKLKIERDNLLYEIDSSTAREKDWRKTVERLSEEVQNLEVQIQNREREQNNQVRVIESKNMQLVQEVKYAKEESEKVRERMRAVEQSNIVNEQKIHNNELNMQQAIYQQDEFKRQLNEARIMVKKREDEISQLQETVLLQEGQKLREIESLNDKLIEVKEANSYLGQLYEAQIADLKHRLINDKKKTEQQADQIINVSQREAVIKQLKKENTGLKAAFAKVKSKNKEMKLQLIGSVEKENLSNTSVANSASTKHSTYRKPGRSANSSRYYNQAEDETQGVDKSVIKLAQLLLTTLPIGTTTSEDKHLALFNQLQRYNKSASRIVELEAEVQKSLNLEAIARDQIQVLKEDNEDLLTQLQEAKDKIKTENRGSHNIKQVTEQLENTKSQLRQAHQELLQLRQEWLPPSEAKSIQEKLKDAQSQLKSMKEEVQRKKDVIQQLRTQKEQTVTEANQVAADLEGLKDDNAKLQRLIRENAKQLGLVQELRSSNDQLRANERRLRDEIVSLSDRLRVTKQDSLRKDTLCRELKERNDQLQEDMAFSKDKDGEVEKLKDQVKKLKLETEIKDNQVRTLKVKIDHFEGVNEQLKKSVREEQKEEQVEAQLKTAKQKLKKAESAYKKCLEGLKKVSKEIANAQLSKGRGNTHTNSMQSVVKNTVQPTANQEQMQMKQYYKDSVNILGMSIDELMDDFVAPKQSSTISENNNPNIKMWEQQLLQTLERLNFSSNINSEELNEVVDQVCNLCMKLLGTIASQSQTVSAISQSPHIHSGSVKMLV